VPAARDECWPAGNVRSLYQIGSAMQGVARTRHHGMQQTHDHATNPLIES